MRLLIMAGRRDLLRRLLRELISALRLSFEAWPDVAQDWPFANMLLRGFRRGFAEKAVLHAINRVICSSFCIRGSRTLLRQSEYEFRILDGFSVPRGSLQVTLNEHKFEHRNERRYSFNEHISSKSTNI